jgi:hypothetical protein
MRFRRRLPIPLAVLLIAGALALIVTLRKHAPPEPARLLPGADGFFYINLKWIRTFATGKLPPVSREPEYQDFVTQTGFQFERDLDKAAFAIHYPKSWGGGTGGSATEPRFSEVFVGKFDSPRLASYLKKVSSSVEDYHGFDIYSIPLEGRTVRVVMLSYDSVAVSNHPDADVIRGMLDRSRKLASPFGGPWLLRRFYRKVPLASLSFAIFKVRPAEMSSLSGFSGWSLLFPKPAVTVVSGRFLRAFHLRVEAFTDSEADARAVTDRASAFLSIFHATEMSIGTQGTDADVKNFFDSLKVEQSGDRAILTAIVPAGFVRKALEEAPPDAIVPEKPAEPPVTAPAEKRPKKQASH